MAAATDTNPKTRRARLEIRIDPTTKRVAEHAAALSFGSMTEYITRLIREDAPRRLAEQALIEVTSDQLERFLAACNDTSRTPGKRLREAAAHLDAEGY